MTREPLPIASGRRTLAVVTSLLRPHRVLAGIAATALLVATGIGLLMPPILGHIVDLVAAHADDSALTTPVVLLVLVAVGHGSITAVGIGLVGRLGENLVAALRERFVDRALRLPLQTLERAGSGDLTSRVTSDVVMVTEVVREAVPQLLRAALMLVLTLAALAVLDWRFLLAVLLAVPIQVLTARWYIGRAVPLYAAHRQAVGAMQHQLLDTVGGARTVRLFGLAERHTGKVRDSSQSTVELAVAGVRLVTRLFGRLNFAEFVGLAAVLVTGFWLVGSGAASIGTATTAALYFHALFNPINTLMMLLDEAQSAGASLVRLVGVADLTPEAEPGDDVQPVDGTIKAAAIGFAFHPGHDVLRDVDLGLSTGEIVALIGASGAGKTTLAKLIAGVHTADRGSIHVGGLSLDELGPAAARRAVVMISQEVHVFAGPLADDLRLARPGATDTELHDALATVDALDWARALPDGLATVVGSGGHRLGAAQAQQLALARLVLADPPIAILDEATADAGSAGSARLETSAASAIRGRTGLVIAHRLTQAAAADRIVVLDAGRVVEEGTHGDLIAAAGRYAELWRVWTAERAGV